MIILLGAGGYIGSAFDAALRERGWSYIPVSRSQVDYTRFDRMRAFLRDTNPDFLINAAGYTGKPNVDACETARADTLQANTLLPQTVAQACSVAGVPWGHVSSGCIYAGAKIVDAGAVRVEKDLTRSDLRSLIEKRPSVVRGFREERSGKMMEGRLQDRKVAPISSPGSPRGVPPGVPAGGDAPHGREAEAVTKLPQCLARNLLTLFE